MEELRGLSCLVCYNAFSSTQDCNIPRNLTCGHTFCTACLEKLSYQYHGLYVQCPTCKCQTLLQHGIKTLPKNFGVLEIIESREGRQQACNSNKDKHKDIARHKCEEHDEEKKVYCYTDECLICIYCQIYGKHQGHKCELASDLAKSSRTELESMAEKLHHEITKMSQGKENLAQVKASIIHRQKFLSETIKKYISILQNHLLIQERKLLHSVDEMSSCKVQALVAQEKTLDEFSTRCEELYLLIQTLQKDSDSSVLEERPTIEKLVDGMLSVSQACQVKPQAHNTLIFQCSQDAIDMMDKYLGTIEQIPSDEKDEERDEGTYENKEMYLRNIIQKLEKEVLQRVEQEDNEQSQECSEDELEAEDEEDDVEEEEEDTSEEEEENESRAEADDDEATSEGELIGAVGGNMLPEAQQDERPKHDKEINKKQGLLRELQHEIERLRLLGPRGDIIRVVDDTSSSSDSENETADGSNTRSLQLDLQITVNNDLGGARPRSRATTSSTMGDLVTVANNRLSRDRKNELNFHKRKQCSVNCQYHLKPTLKCKKCCRVFCKSCASVSVYCNKSEHGHDYVPYRGQDADQPMRQKLRRKVQWECKRCTMVNESHILVCGACETSKDFDPNQVRNVCPMCTLVNEPGKTNCELCDTDLEECYN